MENSSTFKQAGLSYSVILPIFNEEACLDDMLHRINNVLLSLKEPFEIVCIDDGSSDRSWSIIEKTVEKNPHIKGVKFLRNFGHQLAVYAGIKYCQGEYIAVMDADGQDPPELLPELFAKCKMGYDVVNAVRRERKENIFKRMAYKLFYVFYKAIVPFDVPLDSGDFSVFNKNVAEFIRSLDEKTPFIRGLRSWYGGKQVNIEYERQKRLAGTPKYSFWKLILLAANASVSFSKMPLRIISIAGIGISFVSFFYGTTMIIMKLTMGIEVLGWTSTAVLIVFFGGLNLFVLGIIGEYIGNIFDEVKNRPPFSIEKIIGLKL